MCMLFKYVHHIPLFFVVLFFPVTLAFIFAQVFVDYDVYVCVSCTQRKTSVYVYRENVL